MAWPPLGLGDDALLAEVGQEEHVRGVAVDDPRAGHAEGADLLRAAERREDRDAQRSDDLREPRVLARRFDAGGVVERDRVARRVETLEETARFARQPFPDRGDLVLDDRAQERRCRELRRVLELDLRRRHVSSPIRSTARKASCGISTDPTIFMRFLPFFCFSSSLRLRVMSSPYHLVCISFGLVLTVSLLT